MTPEQTDQIDQIRERRSKEYGHSFTGTRGTDAMMKDIDFLLSLVKSAKHNSLDNAVNRMRSACVEKVKSLRAERLKNLHAFANSDNHKDEADYERAVSFVLDGVITALESLSIQEQEASASSEKGEGNG